MGKHGVNPHELTGKLLQPDDWDKLLDERDVIVVDTRNTYEHSIGSFIGASFTNTKSFRDFPEWADKNLNKSKNKKNRNVLHWRNKVRESFILSIGQRLQKCLSAEWRYFEIS